MKWSCFTLFLVILSVNFISSVNGQAAAQSRQSVIDSLTNLTLQSIYESFVSVLRENFAAVRFFSSVSSSGSARSNANNGNNSSSNNSGGGGIGNSATVTFIRNNWQRMLSFLSRASEWFSGEEKDEMFDFIIVGSGSAGSVIANRLSENPNWKVLLLEAGKAENYFSQIPILAPMMQQTQYDWSYVMEYQPGFATGMVNNLLAYPRGKALGGSSVINYMVYTRGHPLDYEKWAMNGNPGWSYNEVLPYFLKSENATLNNGIPEFHGTNGSLHVEDCYQSPLAEAFIKAGEQMGSKRVDYTSSDPFGFATVQANTINGRRQSVAKAFLEPIRMRSNLNIYTSSFVTKININPMTKQATGVEYLRNGKSYKVSASKEVILSAGTFNTPQLLMLSGVGPKQHLNELGIDLIEDLPVGQNMHDHLAYTGLVFKLNKHVSLSPRTIIRPQTFMNWMKNGTGPLSSLGGVEGIAYIKTKMASRDKLNINYPDVELLFISGSLNSDMGFVNKRAMRIRDDVYKEVWGPLNFDSTWTIFPTILHPRSIGGMKLRSKNPMDYPLFYGNYLTDPNDHDLRTMVAAIRYVIRLSRTKAFRQFGSKLHDATVPGCEDFDYDTDDYWKCAVKALSVSLHHQVGTAKMGPPNDPGAVVNPELKVYGVKGLRVADCSVIPFALSGHTNAPSIMVGEKAADYIKKTWENK